MIDISSLKKQALLEDVDTDILEKLAPKIQKLSFKKGSFVFKEKDNTKGIYLVHSGKIEISKNTPDGWKQTITVMGPGHFCGELSILERRLHEANAVAIEDTTIFLLAKEEFERIEKEDIALANIFLKKLSITLSKNIRKMNEKFINVLVNY